jgi:TDG/mug DNA glycosylase family protein
MGYYVGRGSKFWPVLNKTGLTPVQIGPKDFASIRFCKLGLADLAQSVAVRDADLRHGDFDVPGFMAKIRDDHPVCVAFNGPNAARRVLMRHDLAYGPQSDLAHASTVWMLPSTGGANNGQWDEKPWHDLADAVTRLRGAA